MRTLCLNFHRPLDASWAELFLFLSPKLTFLEPNLIFIDIESSRPLFKSEQEMLELAHKKALSFDPEVRIAISDTPYGAEVFSIYQNGKVILTNRELSFLHKLPLEALRYLRGLSPWAQPQRLDQAIDFLKALGLKTLEDLSPIPLESLRQRWGDLGISLWRKLHGQERQEISVFQPTEPLSSYCYFDEPIGNVEALMFSLEKSLSFLFERLKARGRYLANLHVLLRCEYSETQHLLRVQPAESGRDLDLVLQLLKMRLMNVSLDNPVREYDVDIFDTSEKVVQLDLFSPRDDSADRLNRLQSLFSQAELNCGFLHTLPSLLPERSFVLLKAAEKIPNSLLGLPEQSKAFETAEDGSVRSRPEYGKLALNNSPRPSIILEKPKALAVRDLKNFKFLTRFALERIEDDWWCDHQERDYYIAHDKQGAWLWVYQDLKTENYYLHGFFD